MQDNKREHREHECSCSTSAPFIFCLLDATFFSRLRGWGAQEQAWLCSTAERASLNVEVVKLLLTLSALLCSGPAGTWILKTKRTWGLKDLPSLQKPAPRIHPSSDRRTESEACLLICAHLGQF